MKWDIRATELFSVYVIGFLIESWVVQAVNKTNLHVYEIVMIMTKLLSHFSYLFVSWVFVSSCTVKGRVYMHTFPLSGMMCIRLILFFVFFFPSDLPSHGTDGLISGLILARSVFRVILFFLCGYQFMYSIFVKVSVDDKDIKEVVKSKGVILGVLRVALSLLWNKGWREKFLIFFTFFFGFSTAFTQVLAAWALGSVFDGAIADRVSPKTGYIALIAAFLFAFSSFFDQWLKSITSQRLLQETYLQVKKVCKSEKYDLLCQNFLEVRYLFQNNYFDSGIAIIKMGISIIISFMISWNMTILAIFLIPAAIPFKVWEIENSSNMKGLYGIDQLVATSSQNNVPRREFDRLNEIVDNYSWVGSLFNQTTKFMLTLAVIFFVWLSDVYPSSKILSIYFLVQCHYNGCG